MKKNVFCLLTALFFAAVTVYSQPRSAGVRLGYGVSLSYQHTIEKDMVSVDLDFPGFKAIGAAATYDWINPFGTKCWSTPKGEWNWYIGVGAACGLGLDVVKFENRYNEFTVRNSYFGIAGRFGLEYNFQFPLQLSIDWRPVVGPELQTTTETSKYNGEKFNYSSISYYTAGLYASAITLGIRYKF